MKKPVCVIDDDEDVREVMTYALEIEGYEVLSMSNGRKALDLLQSLTRDNYPGLIISDYLMPEMDGVSFIKHIKKFFPDTLGSLPFALSSANGAVDLSEDLPGDIIMMGKPVELEELLRVVKLHCN